MAGDQYWYNKVLGLHCDGTNGSTTFTDVKGKTVTAYGNAQISTAQYPSLTGKSSSAYLDGTGDYLQLSNTSDFDFGSGDFLVRMRFRADSVTGNRILIHRGQATGYGPWAIWTLDANLYAPLSTTGSSWAAEVTGSTTLSVNTWYVAELYRYGTEVGIRLNGTRDAYTTISGSLMVSTASPRIGVNSVGTNAYSGYMSEIEIYKGTCVNTADYTPSGAPFLDEYVSVSGTTKDTSGSFASRLVRVYRQDTGAFVGEQLSNGTTGAYKIEAANTGATVTKHFAVMHVDDANPPTTTDNALIYDDITPA